MLFCGQSSVRRLEYVCAILLFVTVTAPLLRGQATILGTIAGTVTDPQNAVVPNAMVIRCSSEFARAK